MRLKDEKHVWWPYLEDCIKSHNASYAHGTDFKIGGIRESNYADFLAQKRRNESVHLIFNVASLSQRGLLPKSWRKKIWRYQIGDRVCVSVASAYNYELKQSKFAKKSMKGSYVSEIFVIKDAYLRKSWSSPKISVPVYRVFRHSDLPKTTALPGYFYESELTAAPPQ